MSAQDGLARAHPPRAHPTGRRHGIALATGARTVEPTAATPAAMSPETALLTSLGLRPPTAPRPRCGGGVLAADPVAGIPTYREMLRARSRRYPDGDEPAARNQTPVAGAAREARGVEGGRATILSFVALLYLVEIADQISGHALDRNGIRPFQADGLSNTVRALLHREQISFVRQHGAALVLGFVVTLAGWAGPVPRRSSGIVGGFGTWLIGGSVAARCRRITPALRPDFGWLTFLLIFGVVRPAVLADRRGRHRGDRLLQCPVGSAAGAGSLRRSVWQGKYPVRCAAGVLAAYLLSGPERKACVQESRPARRIRMSDRFAPVGIFDSGVVGLRLPGRSSTSCPTKTSSMSATPPTDPTGHWSISEVRAHALRIGDDLRTAVKALVTPATPHRRRAFATRERYDVPVVERVILPAVRRAVATTRSGRIGGSVPGPPLHPAFTRMPSPQL